MKQKWQIIIRFRKSKDDDPHPALQYMDTFELILRKCQVKDMGILRQVSQRWNKTITSIVDDIPAMLQIPNDAIKIYNSLSAPIRYAIARY